MRRFGVESLIRIGGRSEGQKILKSWDLQSSDHTGIMEVNWVVICRTEDEGRMKNSGSHRKPSAMSLAFWKEALTWGSSGPNVTEGKDTAIL